MRSAGAALVALGLLGGAALAAFPAGLPSDGQELPVRQTLPPARAGLNSVKTL